MHFVRNNFYDNIRSQVHLYRKGKNSLLFPTLLFYKYIFTLTKTQNKLCNKNIEKNRNDFHYSYESTMPPMAIPIRALRL